MKDRRKAPLYRRVNTRTHGVFHHTGDKARWTRNAKDGAAKDRQATKMRQGVRRGLDYTPLFKFLLSKVGQDWDAVHSEAVSRLDQEDPIWWMGAQSRAEGRRFVRVGESSFYSGLFIDDDNRLALVDPDLTVEQMQPGCPCCTHTFNGARFTRPYDPARDLGPIDGA